MSKAKKFIEDYTKNCSNVSKGYRSKGISIPSYCIPWLTPDQALRAVEIEREELIENTVEWLIAHILDYTIYEPYLGGVVVNNDLFSDLKKAMKGE